MPVNFAPGDTRPLAKAEIRNSETNEAVECYFNPKEITTDKTVQWNLHPNQELDEATLEFTTAQPQTMQVELMFDCFEAEQLADRDVYKKYISKLEKFSLVQADKKRPPMVTFTWGSAMPVFKGVVEDFNVKYTLFLPDGTPARATVQFKLKHATKLQNKKEAEAANKKEAQQQGKTVTAGASRPDQVYGADGQHRAGMARDGVDGTAPPPGTVATTSPRRR
jgi:hypothetical protein